MKKKLRSNGIFGLLSGGLASSDRDVSDSLRLWPLPEQAPDVPSDDTLTTFLSNPAKLNADLHAQIARSVTCQRRLEVLQLELRKHPQSSLLKGLSTMGATARMVTAMRESGLFRKLAMKSSEGTVDRKCQKQLPLAAGQLFNTRSEVKYWDQDSQRMVSRWTFQPPMVLTLTGGIPQPCDDVLVRVVAVSPAEHWPDALLADDEMLIDVTGLGAYVAHLWLQYPVSKEQLGDCVGALPRRQVIPMQKALEHYAVGRPVPVSLGAGRALVPDQDSIVLLERERLHVRAAYLCATADARMAEWQQSMSSPVALDLAASTAPSSSAKQTFEIVGTALCLVAYPVADGQKIHLRVYNDRGSIATKQALFVKTREGRLQRLKKGDAIMAVGHLTNPPVLTDVSGVPFQLKKIKRKSELDRR